MTAMTDAHAIAAAAAVMVCISSWGVGGAAIMHLDVNRKLPLATKENPIRQGNATRRIAVVIVSIRQSVGLTARCSASAGRCAEGATIALRRVAQSHYATTSRDVGPATAARREDKNENRLRCNENE